MRWCDVLAVAGMISLLILSGCRRGGQTTPPVEFDAGPNVTLLAGEGEVHVTPEGTANANDVLAGDVPVHGQAVFSLTSKLSNGALASYHVNVPIGEVAEFYVAELEKNGWQTDSHRQSEAHVIAASKENRRLVVSIGHGEAAGSAVTLSESSP